MMSSLVDRIKNSISSFVRKDLPEPGIPNKKEFGFCNKALLQRIGLLVIAFCPNQVPPFCIISWARKGINTAALSVNKVRVIFNLLTPIGKTVCSPSNCRFEKYSVSSSQTYLRATAFNVSVSLSSSSKESARCTTVMLQSIILWSRTIKSSKNSLHSLRCSSMS